MDNGKVQPVESFGKEVLIFSQIVHYGPLH